MNDLEIYNKLIMHQNIRNDEFSYITNKLNDKKITTETDYSTYVGTVKHIARRERVVGYFYNLKIGYDRRYKEYPFTSEYEYEYGVQVVDILGAKEVEKIIKVEHGVDDQVSDIMVSQNVQQIINLLKENDDNACISVEIENTATHPYYYDANKIPSKTKGEPRYRIEIVI